MIRFRYIAAVGCLLPALLLGGCTPDPAAPTQAAVCPYREEFADGRAYTGLSPEQQENYAALYTAVRERLDTDTVIHYTAGDDTRETLGLRVELPQPLGDGMAVDALYTAFVTDNPAFFYIGSVYSYEGYKVGDKARYDVLYLTLTMSAAERREAAARLEERLTELTAGLSGRPPAEQELLLHDRLIDACRYDDGAAQSEMPDTEYPFAFTAYGALVQGSAVCEGYARAFQLLCQRQGIPCTLVRGTERATGAAHMWNLVTLPEGDYHVDVTWDDKLDTALHVYWNRTAEEMARTHTLDADSPGRDSGPAGADYYTVTGRHQARYDRSAIAAAVAAAVERGDETVELSFPPERLPSVGVFVSNRTWFSGAVAEYLPAGQSLWDYTMHTFPQDGVLVLRRFSGS